VCPPLGKSPLLVAWWHALGASVVPYMPCDMPSRASVCCWHALGASVLLNHPGSAITEGCAPQGVPPPGDEPPPCVGHLCTSSSSFFLSYRGDWVRLPTPLLPPRAGFPGRFSSVDEGFSVWSCSNHAMFPRATARIPSPPRRAPFRGCPGLDKSWPGLPRLRVKHAARAA